MILDKYNNTFNDFITKYEEIHINPWHNISKEDFKKLDKSLLKEVIFKPNYYITQTKDDFINNKDTILEFALNLK